MIAALAAEYEHFSNQEVLEDYPPVSDYIEQLNGHRFSPHPYTIYSMRSTFIEDQLMKGTPVMEVAEMAGHDVRETQRTYARLNLRRKGTELTLPEMGKKRTESKPIDLFNEE